ncbi:MAG: Uma2 family endonuclease [Planctomycetota bacterium]
MTAARKYIPHYTIEDHATWEGDWELWDGVPIAMSPGPLGRHQMVARRLMRKLEDALLLAECDAEVVHELDWIVGVNTLVRPDIVVVCGGIPDRYLETAPALACEVLSDATRDRDMHYKRALYEKEGVSVYLVAHPDAGSVQAWARNRDGEFQAAPPGEIGAFRICEDCQISLDCSDIFLN